MINLASGKAIMLHVKSRGEIVIDEDAEITDS